MQSTQKSVAYQFSAIIIDRQWNCVDCSLENDGKYEIIAWKQKVVFLFKHERNSTTEEAFFTSKER